MVELRIGWQKKSVPGTKEVHGAGCGHKRRGRQKYNK